MPYILNGVPVLTANNVNELMETLGWWRMNQGGITSLRSIIEGIIIDAHSCDAEYLDDHNIMTRLSWQQPGMGGHFGPRLTMAQNNLAGRQQIGVIINKDHPSLAKLGIGLPAGEELALMEYWILTDYWIDWQQGSKVLMARLEKVTRQNVWWHYPASDNDVMDIDDDDDDHPLSPQFETCQTCGQVGRSRYNEGFICGRPDCASSTNQPSTNTLGVARTYRKDYLSHTANMHGLPPPPYPYLPGPPTQPTADQIRAMFADPNNDRPLWKGYLCQHCLVFNQRVYWNRLECRICHDVLNVRLPDFTYEGLQDPHWLDLQPDSDISGIKLVADANIIETTAVTDRLIVRKWALYDNNFVWLILPRKQAIYEPGGFKDLFGRLWNAARSGGLDLKRLPINSRPGQLTAWFGLNIGAEYRTRMTVRSSFSFSNEPSIITEVRNKLTSIVQEVTGADPGFNELLTIGMHPKMHMGWHSDGEKSVLGNVVAAISLGGPAEMSFGLNRRYEVNPTALLDDPIIPGAKRETEKRNLKTQADSGNITRDEHQTQLRALVRDIPVGRRVPTPLLTFPLPGTGAIMIQQGQTLNKIYMHKVDGKGICRIVNTGRLLQDDLLTVATQGDDDHADDVDTEIKPGKGNKRSKKTDAKDDGPAPKRTRRR